MCARAGKRESLEPTDVDGTLRKTLGRSLLKLGDELYGGVLTLEL